MDTDTGAHNSMWLQESFKMPDPLTNHKADLEAEVKIMRSKLNSVTAERDALRTTQNARASTPLATPTRRRVSLSLANCAGTEGDMVSRQQLTQAMDELTRARRAIDASKEELASVSQILEAEKATANSYRERFIAEQRQRSELEDRVHDAESGGRRKLEALQQQLRQAEAKLTLAEEDAERNAKAHATALQDRVREAVEEAQEEARCLQAELDVAQGRAANAAAATEQLATLRRSMEEQSSRAHADAAEARAAIATAEAARDEVETTLRAQLSTMRDDHARALMRQEQEHALRLDEVRNAAVEQVAQAKARNSAAVTLRADLTVAVTRAEALEEQLQARNVELETAQHAAAATRRRLEEERARAVDTLEAEHHAALKRLIDEHYAEMAEVKARASASEMHVDRANRLEGEVADLQARLEATEAEAASARGEVEMARRICTRESERTAALEQRLRAAETALEDFEAQSAATLEAERAAAAARTQELFQQVQELHEERDEEQEEWRSQINDARQRTADAEAELQSKVSELTKERLALMAGASEARRQLADVTFERDQALHQVRTAEKKADRCEEEASAAVRDRDVALDVLDETKKRLVDGQRASLSHDVEVAALRKTITALEARAQVPATAALSTHVARAAPTPSPAPRPIAVPSLSPAPALTAPQSPTPTPESQPFAFSQPARTKSLREPLAVQDTNAPLVSALKKQRLDDGTAAASTMAVADTAERVVAVSGFDSKEIVNLVARLPNARFVSCKSNGGVPTGVTHLVSAGGLTVKLLSAVVRCCWVVDEDYIRSCVAAGQWLDEAEHGGFRHETPPLKGRRVAFTAAFRESRHFNTLKLVAADGAALVLDETDPALEPSGNVMCTSAEYVSLKKAGYKMRPTTWDLMVKALYPQHQ